MEVLRVRNFDVDVIPDGEPFIRVTVEKIIIDGGSTTQIIGNFDRIYKRMSDIPAVELGDIASDGKLDMLELYNVLAQIMYAWVMAKHGGQIIDGKLVVG